MRTAKFTKVEGRASWNGPMGFSKSREPIILAADVCPEETPSTVADEATVPAEVMAVAERALGNGNSITPLGGGFVLTQMWVWSR